VTASRQIPPTGAVSPRRLADAINAALQGRIESRGSVTLTAGATTTTVDHPLAHAESVILLMPTTANAAAALANVYVSARASRTFTLTHANNAQVDRTFEFMVLG